MNLENLNLVELNAREIQETEGGGAIAEGIGWLVGAIGGAINNYWGMQSEIANHYENIHCQ